MLPVRRSQRQATEAEIIEKVKKATRPYNNKNYSVMASVSIGKVTIHPVSFEGQDDEARVHYVVEDATGALRVFFDLPSATEYLSYASYRPWYDVAVIQTYILGIASLLIVLAITYIAVFGRGNENLAVLIAFGGSVAGLFVGRGKSHDRD